MSFALLYIPSTLSDGANGGILCAPHQLFRMVNSCSWCQVAYWEYRCFTCDPRREKVLCANCSVLWHSRGFACHHQLTNRHGVTQSFSAWISPQQHRVRRGNNSSETAIQEAGVDGTSDVFDGDQAQEVAIDGMEVITITGSEKSKEETQVEKGMDSCFEESKRKEEEKKGEVVEKDVEAEVVGESGEEGVTVSVEEIEFKEKTMNAFSAIKAPASENFVSGMNTPVKRSGPKMEGQFELNDQGEDKTDFSVPIASAVQGISSALFLSPSVQDGHASSATAETSTVPANSYAPACANTTPDASDAVRPQEPTRTCTPTTDTPDERASSNSMRQPAELVDLENLLQWFPTTDPTLMEMLATWVEEALLIEDALICARIGKCQESSCRLVLLHYEHCKHENLCGDPKCVEISIVYRHRRACSKKDITRDGKEFVCPFCLRIRQRRNLGCIAALDHLISDQRRALQGGHSEADRNVGLQSINTWSNRKQALRAKVDRLNQLASESDALIFNFPRYQWHFGDAVFIKREPTLLESENDTTGLSAPDPSMNGTNESTATEQPSSTRSTDEHNIATDTLQSEEVQEESMADDGLFNADFINELLWAKTEAGEGREVSQREFDRVMELGYAIVDASFCAPSKAQQCLLNCKSILMHLQHHLDLQVCTQEMCAAVEHHFSHLSQCKAHDENESCEYCLRVEECQMMRSVDFMEAERPEVEAKVQKIIKDITASFTNHRPDKRKQMEDELEQAEVNKQDFLRKLSAACMNLQKVRRSMERHGLSTSIFSRELPVHFINVRRAEGSGSSSKKLRLT